MWRIWQNRRESPAAISTQTWFVYWAHPRAKFRRDLFWQSKLKSRNPTNKRLPKRRNVWILASSPKDGPDFLTGVGDNCTLEHVTIDQNWRNRQQQTSFANKPYKIFSVRANSSAHSSITWTIFKNNKIGFCNFWQSEEKFLKRRIRGWRNSAWAALRKVRSEVRTMPSSGWATIRVRLSRCG